MEKKVAILTAVLMSCFMALVLSGVFTFLSFGATLAWASAWLNGFAIAWPLALALVLIFGRPISKLAERLAGATPK